MKFTKMHGLGNDYIYVNCFEETVSNPEEVDIKVSHRHFGVGADGLIMICPSKVADFMMDMYNNDGSRGKMCGNGIRCVAKYVYDHGMTSKTTITIETLSGIKTLELHLGSDGKVATVTVDMGEPILKPADIPCLFEGDTAICQPMTVDGKAYDITAVSMGNPHCVVFVDDAKAVDLYKIGPSFEHHEMFPERVNTEFIQVLDRNTLRMRVWERGTGITMACGTGACASAVAAILNKLTEDTVLIHLDGGDLKITYDRTTGHVIMEGPAATVCTGEWFE